MQTTELTIDNLNDLTVNELGIILSDTKITTCRKAVLAIHKIKMMEEAITVMKKEANEVLDIYGEEITATDKDGQKYAVKRVPMNEKVYTQTREYKAAEEALNDAKDHFADVKTVTPYKTVAKGAGFFYKTATLDNLESNKR